MSDNRGVSRFGPCACQRCGYDQPECTCIGGYVAPPPAGAAAMTAREVIAEVLRQNGGHVSGNEDRILAALSAAPEAVRLELARQLAGDAHRVVPVEPTREMRLAFHDANEEYESGRIFPETSPDYQWRAMLAAAAEDQR